MKVVVQRVSEASVKVNEIPVGKIDKGIMLLVGFTEGDNEEIIEKMAQKIINLRIFDDDKGIMNLSVKDINGKILSISQFTLYADTKKGNRPSYKNALRADLASKLYDLFNEYLRKEIDIETGIFQSEMKVSLTNDGPVTIILGEE